MQTLLNTPDEYLTAELVKRITALRDERQPQDVALTTALAITCDLTPPFDRDWLGHLIDAIYQEGEHPLRLLTIPEFTAITPDIAWIAAPWVASGAITEISGKIKEAGKTTFALAMCAAVLREEDFLGTPTTRTNIIYMTEQAGPSYLAGLDRAHLLPDTPGLFILPWGGIRGSTWPDVVLSIITEAHRRNVGMVIVDTLPPFAGISGDDEGKAGAALEAMHPLVTAAGMFGLAIVIMRHERKAGGSVADAGRGSSAFGGAVDTLINIGRPKHDPDPSVRHLSALSRFADVPEKLRIRYADGVYYRADPEDAVRAALAAGGTMTLTDIASAATLTTEAVEGVLTTMDGVSTVESKTLGVPTRYMVEG